MAILICWLLKYKITLFKQNHTKIKNYISKESSKLILIMIPNLLWKKEIPLIKSFKILKKAKGMKVIIKVDQTAGESKSHQREEEEEIQMKNQEKSLNLFHLQGKRKRGIWTNWQIKRPSWYQWTAYKKEKNLKKT